MTCPILTINLDNEQQLLLPILLRAVLGLLWGERTDWVLGINLGLYYDPHQNSIQTLLEQMDGG